MEILATVLPKEEKAMRKAAQKRYLTLTSMPMLPVCVGLSVALMLRWLYQLWPGPRRLVTVGGIALMASIVNVVPAQATDVIIINGSGCQVTEEDAVGLLLHSNLYLRIDFPDSHWRLGLRNDGLKGLSLVDVSLQAAQFTSKQYLIKHAGMAEIFVPYDDGTYNDYDMDRSNAMDQIDAADLPAQLGSLVYLRKPSGIYYIRDPYPKVAVECREAGIAWLCKDGPNRIRRRVHEIVVWGVYDADNYDNIIEYTFHEDGSISFRYGATGYNLVSNPNAPHVHNGLWRVSTKLFGRTDNQALYFQHVESMNGTYATDSEPQITNEAALVWDPFKFNNVIVQSDSQMNDYGHLMGYEFLPGTRTGTGRFSQRPQDKELWTLADYYVTNDDPGDDGSGSGMDNWRYTWYSPDDYLLRYVERQQIVGADGDAVAIWYIGSAHHDPTDEDNWKGSGERSGVTLVHWTGFDMKPHNLFDYNPLGGPRRCDVPE
jgi:Cu2+-containing amine oxidase